MLTSGHSGQASQEGSRPPSREPSRAVTKTLLDWINQVNILIMWTWRSVTILLQAGNNSLESIADSCYR